MPTVVIAPDGFGGTLRAREAAEAMAAGWRDARPDDDLVLVPMSDGGEGLLDVVATAADVWRSTEVAGPLGRPVEAGWLLRPDGTAVVESACACGLVLVAPEQRDATRTTTYGVGQLIDAARRDGAVRILVGLGGSATVDGGAGALTALGLRPTVADGSGLKIGGGELGRVTGIGRDWLADFSGVSVELLADVMTPLEDSARLFGPQKGASPEQVDALTRALLTWADVVEHELGSGERLRERPGAGSAGGLGFGLLVGLGARLVEGSRAVGELVGLAGLVSDAEVVLTGEGKLDATTSQGKVVAHVAALARDRGIGVRAVVGRLETDPVGLDDVREASGGGPSADPAMDVRIAARRSAEGWSP